MPFNLGAAEVRDDLRNTLSTWVRELWETHGPRRAVPTGETGPDGEPLVDGVLDDLDLVPDMAAWLRRHPSWIEYHPAGGELVDEVGDTVERVRDPALFPLRGNDLR
ncbi:hypothetical protein [Lentzea flaviverrucosa]|uniref:Uncharacterized protein n=1 Tax=Lentzea flaviverrucosa TaxID=200379 RepID=A0A1H9XKG8_9PSEU|nr:hypothetical protein [Lentzea flaviverrucosa]RDI20342.1 hypothetical protein DFR72_115185 [Lentzea flaviverrucosa]SES46665.1 hypothetical protein SAMN05216195_115185 [Lentzea flaviverrucosa]